MSSLFKRVAVPLLAVVAAAALWAPTRAATASFDICQAIYPGTTHQGVAERVKCSFTGPGTTYWIQEDFHAVGSGDSHSSTQNPYMGGMAGDYYYPQEQNQSIYLGPTISGTYTCWAICYLENSGTYYTVSTGGTDQVTF